MICGWERVHESPLWLHQDSIQERETSPHEAYQTSAPFLGWQRRWPPCLSLKEDNMWCLRYRFRFWCFLMSTMASWDPDVRASNQDLWKGLHRALWSTWGGWQNRQQRNISASYNQNLAPFRHVLVIFVDKLTLMKGENCVTMTTERKKLPFCEKLWREPLHSVTTGGQIMSF